MPFSPAIVNYTVGTTWIILEWTHNQSCCTNGSYSLSWEPLQSKESFPDRNKTDNPSQRHNITQLRAGTTYVIILVAKCPGYHVMNDTQIVITFNGKLIFMHQFDRILSLYAIVPWYVCLCMCVSACMHQQCIYIAVRGECYNQLSFLLITIVAPCDGY